jgi:hypothetical protein
MRVINQEKRCVSYMLNILGLRVFEGRCELIAKHGDEWVAIGNARELPLDESVRADQHSDPFLLTVSQYDVTFPDSDLLPLLQGKRSIEQALSSNRSAAGSA